MSSAFEISSTPVVEAIEFKDLSLDIQKLLHYRIGVRVGDKLTIGARSRIGRELGKIQNNRTFTYKPGSALAKAR